MVTRMRGGDCAALAEKCGCRGDGGGCGGRQEEVEAGPEEMAGQQRT